MNKKKVMIIITITIVLIIVMLFVTGVIDVPISMISGTTEPTSFSGGMGGTV